MATDTDSEYISDLPAIIELQPTDSFIVETLEGTKQILFKDFIIGPDNVSFYTEVVQTQEDLLTLSLQVSELSSSVSTLNVAVTALTAGYNEVLRNGFATVSIDSLGTLTVLASSSNVSGIISTAAGSRIQISTTGGINFLTACIQTTLNYYTSGSAFTDDFLTYSTVVDGLGTNQFTVGINKIEVTQETVSLPTTVTPVYKTFSPVTQILKTSSNFQYIQSINVTPVDVLAPPTSAPVTISVAKTVAGTQANATNVVNSVEALTDDIGYTEKITLTNTNYTIPSFENIGNSFPILGNTGAPLVFYITFRY